MARKHNDANILNMGARVLSPEAALEIVAIWLNTKFEGDKVPRCRQHLDYMQEVVERNNFK